MEYEERELILELFPGTSPDLLPIGEILYYRDEEGRVVSVAFRDRLDAHRLIEEFMILRSLTIQITYIR